MTSSVKTIFQARHLTEWLREPSPTTNWIIPNLIPYEAIVWVSGPRKTGFKSWFGFTACASAASGIKANKYIKVQEPINVVIIEEEGTTPDTKNRWRKIQLGLFNHDFWHGDMFNGRLAWFHHIRFKMDRRDHVAMICKYIKDNNIKLAMFDAMTYMHHGDENSKQDMHIVVDACFKIRGTGATVMGLVHTRKPTMADDGDIDNDIRGSSIMADAYDGHLGFRRHKETDQLMLISRFRDHVGAKYDVWWGIDKCIEDQEADPKQYAICQALKCGHKVRNLTIAPMGRLSVAKNHFDKNILGHFQPGEIYNLTDLRNRLGIPAARAREIRNALLDANLLREGPKKGTWIVPFGVKP